MYSLQLCFLILTGRAAPRAAPRPSPVRNPPQPGNFFSAIHVFMMK